MRTSAPLALVITVFLSMPACSGPPADPYLMQLLPFVAAPGSGEPHLGPGPQGTVIMSWLEPSGDGVALRYSTLGDDIWSQPRTVASGDNWFVNWADFPSVEAIDDSLWAAHWLVKAADGTYEYDIAVSISTDAGKTWGQPVTPHTDGTLSEHGFVSLYPDGGGVGAVWLDGRNMAHGMTLRSAMLTKGGEITDGQLADDLVCDCCQTDVAIGPAGPIAVYRNRTEEEIRDVYVMRMIDGEWGAGRPVARDGWEIAACPVNGPAIAARGNDVAVAWFTAADGESRVRMARSDDGAKTFGAPVDLDIDRPIGRVDVVLLEDRTAIVSWLRQGEGGNGDVLARAISADGQLGPVSRVATTSAGRLSGFPQIAQHGDGIVFAWTNVDGDASRVTTLSYNAGELVGQLAGAPEQCPPSDGIALQVLGSGGPIADDARASTSYIVWVDGKSRVMIDAGGGSFLRFGEAGARFEDLDFIGLSHFHTDHSADFPALLKSGYFANRQRELAVAGPGGNGPFPGLHTYLDSMLNANDGAYGYLGGYLDGTGGLIRLVPQEVVGDGPERVTVYEDDDMHIDAMHVPHGIVPALAFRVTVGDKALVFSSDQNLAKPQFAEFAKDASLLVIHMVLPEGATSGRSLHAVPSEIGEFAATASPERLLLSHFMARSLRDLDGNVSLVRSSYEGPITLANDLACVDLAH